MRKESQHLLKVGNMTKGLVTISLPQYLAEPRQRSLLQLTAPTVVVAGRVPRLEVRQHDAQHHRVRHRDAYTVEISARARSTGAWLCDAAYASDVTPTTIIAALDRATYCAWETRFTAFEADGARARVEPTLTWEAGPNMISHDEAISHHMSQADCCDAHAIYVKYLMPKLRRATEAARGRLTRMKGGDLTPQAVLIMVKLWHGAGGALLLGRPTRPGLFHKLTAAEATDIESLLKCAVDIEAGYYPAVYGEYGAIHTRNAAFCAGVPLDLANQIVPYHSPELKRKR